MQYFVRETPPWAKRASVAEQELQESIPPWQCFWPSASLQLLPQAGKQDVVGISLGRCGKGRESAFYSKAQDYDMERSKRLTKFVRKEGWGKKSWSRKSLQLGASRGSHSWLQLGEPPLLLRDSVSCPCPCPSRHKSSRLQNALP